jgi:hypothetical protein
MVPHSILKLPSVISKNNSLFVSCSALNCCVPVKRLKCTATVYEVH